MSPTPFSLPHAGSPRSMSIAAQILGTFAVGFLAVTACASLGIWLALQTHQIWLALVVALPLAVAATASVAVWQIRQIAVPVHGLAQVAGQLALGDVAQLAVAASMHAPREIGQLAMALQQAVTSQQEVMAIVTPLADGDLTLSREASEKAMKGPIVTPFVKMLHTIIQRQIDYAEIAQHIGEGGIPDLAHLLRRYEGKPATTGTLAKSLVQMSDTLRELVTAATHLADGELVPIDEIEARYQGDDKKGILAKALNKIIHRQIEYAEIAQRVGDGDLTRIDHLLARYEGKPNAGIIAKALSKMIDNLRTLVGTINEMSAGVASASAQIVEAAEQSGHATEQVAQTIQQVAAGAQSQSAQLGDAAREIDSLTHESNVLQSESQETMHAMETLKQSVSVTAERIRRLGQQSDQIVQIVQTIDEIAEQTNLLALNAAIEAARAGDHGRGFAVVADEVRKLAERSASATKEIEHIIHETQTETGQAVEAMEHGVVQVEDGVTRAARTEQQAQTMVQSTLQISQAINSVASVGEENSAAAEEVSAATEEMAAQVEETVASTQTLSQLADQLRDAVSTFRLDGGTQQNQNVRLVRRAA